MKSTDSAIANFSNLCFLTIEGLISAAAVLSYRYMLYAHAREMAVFISAMLAISLRDLRTIVKAKGTSPGSLQ